MSDTHDTIDGLLAEFRVVRGKGGRDMKITIWIRAQRDNPDAITLHLDTKYETYDTPVVSRYGNKLANAIEGSAEKE